jgi:hypothetical protein
VFRFAPAGLHNYFLPILHSGRFCDPGRCTRGVSRTRAAEVHGGGRGKDVKENPPCVLGLTCFTGSRHSAQRYSHHLTYEGTDVKLISEPAYNAFIKYGKSSSWCRSHALSFRAMSRAVSIRSQLKKYMHRFNLPIESCNGDVRRLRQCLVTGYWQNSAQWRADGAYISAHGKIVRLPFISCPADAKISP